jgi:SLOG cluster4 family
MDDHTMLEPGKGDPAHSAAKIAQEFEEGFELLTRIDRPAATMLGSARIDEADPVYGAAREIGREFAQRGWAVITGVGPGAMEAANRGAQEAGGLSVGLGIALPHEQAMNRYVDLSSTPSCFSAPSIGPASLDGSGRTCSQDDSSRRRTPDSSV